MAQSEHLQLQFPPPKVDGPLVQTAMYSIKPNRKEGCDGWPKSIRKLPIPAWSDLADIINIILQWHHSCPAGHEHGSTIRKTSRGRA